MTVIGDGTPPDTAINLPQEPSFPGVRPVACGACFHCPSAGTTIAGYPGSGIAGVEVLLQTADGSDLGWQETTYIPFAQSGNNVEQTIWSGDYEIPTSLGDPAGSYTVTVRARIGVGNETERVGGMLELITVNMEATMTSEDPRTITEEVTISGVISSTTGIAASKPVTCPSTTSW